MQGNYRKIVQGYGYDDVEGGKTLQLPQNWFPPQTAKENQNVKTKQK